MKEIAIFRNRDDFLMNLYKIIQLESRPYTEIHGGTAFTKESYVVAQSFQEAASIYQEKFPNWAIEKIQQLTFGIGVGVVLLWNEGA